MNNDNSNTDNSEDTLAKDASFLTDRVPTRVRIKLKRGRKPKKPGEKKVYKPKRDANFKARRAYRAKLKRWVEKGVYSQEEADELYERFDPEAPKKPGRPKGATAKAKAAQKAVATRAKKLEEHIEVQEAIINDLKEQQKYSIKLPEFSPEQEKQITALFPTLNDKMKTLILLWTFNGHNIAKAVRESGYSDSSYEFCREKIMSKEAQAFSNYILMGHIVDKNLTTDEVIDKTRKVYDEAMKAADFKEARESVTLLAKIKGMLVERKESTSNNIVSQHISGDSAIDVTNDIETFKNILRQTVRNNVTSYTPNGFSNSTIAVENKRKE